MAERGRPRNAVATLLLGALVGVGVAKGGIVLGLVAGMIIIGLVLYVFRDRVPAFVMGWLAVAPFVQSIARSSSTGYALNVGLYVFPTVALLVWALTGAASAARRLSPVDAMPLIFLLFAGVSVAVAPLQGGLTRLNLAMQVYLSFGIGIVLYYLAASGQLRGWESRIVSVLIAVSVPLSLMALVEKATGWNLWSYTLWQSVDIGRVVGPLGNPAVLATCISMGIVCALARFAFEGGRIGWLGAASLLLGIPAVWFTYARASLIALLVVGLVMMSVRSALRWLAISLLVVAAVVLTVSWGSMTTTNVYTQRLSNESNGQARVLIAGWSLRLAASRPLQGWGYGTFDSVKNAAGLDSGDLPYSYGTANTSHNTLLTVIVELGFVAAFIMLLPWWHTLRASIVRLVRAGPDWIGVALMAVIAVYAINALFIDMRFFSIVPAVPWLALGLLRDMSLESL